MFFLFYRSIYRILVTKQNMMDKLKKMYLKSAQLCDDYVDSLEYEKCVHHIVETFDSGGYGYGETRLLLLIETLTGKIVKDGGLIRIKSYINLRKLDKKKIYKWGEIVCGYDE